MVGCVGSIQSARGDVGAWGGGQDQVRAAEMDAAVSIHDDACGVVQVGDGEQLG